MTSRAEGRTITSMFRLAPILLVAACQASSPDVVASQAPAPVAPPPAVAPVTPVKAKEKARVAVGPDSDTLDTSVIVGKPAPALEVDWMGAAAPADLKGNVVLVRWFTEGCPYCQATAPSLVIGPLGASVRGRF